MILCFFPLLGCFFFAIYVTRQTFIKRCLPSPIIVNKATRHAPNITVNCTPRAPNITVNWYMQHPFTGELTEARPNRSSNKTMSTSDVLQKNVVGNKTQHLVVSASLTVFTG